MRCLEDARHTGARQLARALTLALAATLALATGAGAQSVTLGPSLDQGGPNFPDENGFGCDLRPTMTPYNTWALEPTGVTTCSWSARMAAHPAGHVARAGAGRITSVSVRSGPNPAPLRFQILREYNYWKQPPENPPRLIINCCWLRSQTDVFQPAPNTISTFAVDLPVHTQFLPTSDSYGHTDTVSIAAAGPGSLPIRQLPEWAGSASMPTTPETPFAEHYYPAMGDGPTDWEGNVAGPGRPPWGAQPGFIILMNANWSATGGGDPPAQLPPGGPPPPGTPPIGAPIPVRPPLQVLSRDGRIRNGRVPVRFACPPGRDCRGTARILRRPARAAQAATAAAAARKPVTLASGTLRIKAGTRRVVRLKLSKAGRRAMRGRKKLKATLVAKVGTRTVRKGFTLRR